MIQLPVSELARIINASTAGGHGHISGVGTDSRDIKQGQCFFAIRGENFDGHDFVNTALCGGAACAVVDRRYNHQPSPKILTVTDTVKALGQLAGHYRWSRPFKVIAITGSVGKTTARHIIAAVLARKFKIHQSPANFNNSIGLPLTLLGAEADCEIIIAELGTNSPGEIEVLSKTASPDIAVVTAVKPAHLAGFETFEHLLAEKLSIAKGLRTGGMLILPAELTQSPQCPKGDFTVAAIPPMPEDMVFSDKGSNFTLAGRKMTLPLAGAGNVANVVVAWAVCSSLGIEADDFAEAIGLLKPIKMRTEIVEYADVTVINDCYNASPASMENALGILAQMGRRHSRRKVFICGEMAELGQDADKFHRQLGQTAAALQIDMILAVGQSAKLVAETAKNHYDGIETEFFKNTESLCDNLQKYLQKYDIVLVKGSRSARLERAVEKIKNLQNDTTPLRTPAAKR